MPTPILEPGQIEAAAGEIPELRFAPADLFSSGACASWRKAIPWAI